MKKNMGRWDRTLRLVAALIITVLIIVGAVKGTVAITLFIVAAIFVITTLVGFCPLYKPMGISTKEGKEGDGPTRLDNV
jgi:hypothetical protein